MQEHVKVAEDVRQGDVDEKAGCEGNCGEKRGVSTCTQHANWCDLCETFSTLISKDTRVQDQGLVMAEACSRTVEWRNTD